LAGRKTIFPAVTPTATPAFSIASSAGNKEGHSAVRVVAKTNVTNPLLIFLVIGLTSKKEF
jgi:hypothetical protein